MSKGKPAVISVVVVNNTIVKQGKGFLCNGEQQLYETLYILIEDEQLRINVGKNE